MLHEKLKRRSSCGENTSTAEASSAVKILSGPSIISYHADEDEDSAIALDLEEITNTKGLQL